MADGIGSGLSSMSICFDFTRSVNVGSYADLFGPLSSRNSTLGCGLSFQKFRIWQQFVNTGILARLCPFKQEANQIVKYLEHIFHHGILLDLPHSFHYVFFILGPIWKRWKNFRCRWRCFCPKPGTPEKTRTINISKTTNIRPFSPEPWEAWCEIITFVVPNFPPFYCLVVSTQWRSCWGWWSIL